MTVTYKTLQEFTNAVETQLDVIEKAVFNFDPTAAAKAIQHIREHHVALLTRVTSLAGDLPPTPFQPPGPDDPSLPPRPAGTTEDPDLPPADPAAQQSPIPQTEEVEEVAGLSANTMP